MNHPTHIEEFNHLVAAVSAKLTARYEHGITEVSIGLIGDSWVFPCDGQLYTLPCGIEFSEDNVNPLTLNAFVEGGLACVLRDWLASPTVLFNSAFCDAFNSPEFDRYNIHAPADSLIFRGLYAINSKCFEYSRSSLFDMNLDFMGQHEIIDLGDGFKYLNLIHKDIRDIAF